MKIILFISYVIILTSCNPKVVSYLNKDAKFDQFESYDLVNIKIDKRKLANETARYFNSMASQINFHMSEKRGYELSKINPDLILRYELIANTTTRTNTGSGLNPFTAIINTRVFYESVILLELFHSGKLVWQGSYDLTQTRRDRRNVETIKKAVDYIFTTFPYTAKFSDPDQTLRNIKNNK